MTLQTTKKLNPMWPSVWANLKQLIERVAMVHKREGWPGVTTRAAKVIKSTLPIGTRGYRQANHGGLGEAPLAVLISGEPETPGHFYRVEHLAEALAAAGFVCRIYDLANLPTTIASQPETRILWIWRCVHSARLESLIHTARQSGAIVLYDCDDLMFEPELATPEFIDAIRSGDYDAKAVAEHYALIRRAMLLADALTASTRPLATAMRSHFRPVFVTPNCFDHETHARAAAARTLWHGAQDGLIRIGYASGTLTHQRDFAQAAEGVAACLRRNPHVRLVLFRRSKTALLNVDEFSCLKDLQGRIEWRPFVSLTELPVELARFDINLAPLEHGNRYVEAKSELKYFDAALVKVPTVASPTQVFSAAITNGVNGLLAGAPGEWESALQKLVDNPLLRKRLGEAAYHHALAYHGPLSKAHTTRRCVAMMFGDEFSRATAFQSELARQPASWKMPPCSEARVVFTHVSTKAPRASVVMPVYNYASVVGEALESVANQSLQDLELVVVDDASTDESLAVVSAWIENHKERFCRVTILSNYVNSGLGMTRNRAIAETTSLYVLPLDADNKLAANCVEELLNTLEKSPAALAYPLIQHFGDSLAQMGYHKWHPMLFACHNYVDAMAMLNKSAWSDVGGYEAERSGWEDYDFCCKLAEAGYWGLRVPSAKAFYRVHRNSMLRAFTEQSEARRKIADVFRKKHPWLDIPGY